MYELRFIYPVRGCIHDITEDDVWDLSSEKLTNYKELLNNKIKEYQLTHFSDEDMKHYFDKNEDVKSKLKSAFWCFDDFDGILYGITIVELTDTIDEQEVVDLKHWIKGQNSDGIGEFFEDNIFDIGSLPEFDVDDARLSVALYDPRSYYIFTESEFIQNVLTKDKYTVDLLDKAVETLCKNGMAEEALEMRKLVETSSNHYERLEIMSKYVNLCNI